MYISRVCKIPMDTTTFFYIGLGILAFGIIVLFTGIGLVIYWASSSNKEEPFEKDIKDIKTEIKGIRRELQKLPTAIVAIIKHPSEIGNTEAITKTENTKIKSTKSKSRKRQG